jgi:hypothetical protein
MIWLREHNSEMSILHYGLSLKHKERMMNKRYHLMSSWIIGYYLTLSLGCGDTPSPHEKIAQLELKSQAIYVNPTLCNKEKDVCPVYINSAECDELMVKVEGDQQCQICKKKGQADKTLRCTPQEKHVPQGIYPLLSTDQKLLFEKKSLLEDNIKNAVGLAAKESCNQATVDIYADGSHRTRCAEKPELDDVGIDLNCSWDSMDNCVSCMDSNKNLVYSSCPMRESNCFGLWFLWSKASVVKDCWEGSVQTSGCTAYNRDGLTCGQVGWGEGHAGCKWEGSFRCEGGCLKWQGNCNTGCGSNGCDVYGGGFSGGGSYSGSGGTVQGGCERVNVNVNVPYTDVEVCVSGSQTSVYVNAGGTRTQLNVYHASVSQLKKECKRIGSKHEVYYCYGSSIKGFYTPSYSGSTTVSY